MPSGGVKALAMALKREVLLAESTCCCKVGKEASASRRLASSRGRTESKAMRVAMRSRSGNLLSSVRSKCKSGVECNNSLRWSLAPIRLAIACCRSSTGALSRKG